jgi:PAS domain S-box-containing protein
MKRLSSRFYMTLGLSAIVVTCMLLALFAGLVPDRDGAARQTRATLAESTAVSVTLLLANDSADQRIRQLLGFVVERNPELLSVGLRGADGKLRLWAGDHPQTFPLASDGSSTETHVRLPLMQGGKPWGQAELVFVRLHGEGWKALIGAPPLMISSVGAMCFLLFYLYLSRTLRHLDPSRVIPGRVRTAFDTLAEGLLVLDPKGQIVLANKAFADVMGLDGDALTGKAVASLGWTQPVQEGVPPMLWNVVLTQGHAFRNVLMYLPDAKGQRRSFMMNGSNVPGAGGKSAGMLVSLDDVTSLEEKEIQLRLARDAAEAANRAKSDFLANMSHEIRTPMNAILGFAELLKRGWHNGGSQSQRHLDTIVSSGKHLLALINDILDLSKVEAGRMEVERIPCAVHEVVNDVASIMRVKADEKQIGLEVIYPQALPAELLADPARLRQIITNLVGNALKFTQKGGVRIEVKLLRKSPTAVLGIDVSDSGIGIAQDKLEDIFEPFVQAEASTTRQFGGTGLGLAISRRFARALGGDIRASSVPGRGSTFHVTLDVGEIARTVAWLPPEELASHRGGSAADSDLRWVFDGQTVLVVDDGAENRELVRLVLEGVGLRVVEAENGAIALQRVTEERPVMVLMDVQMPVMDGYTATRRLREMGYTQPIMALTANAMKGFEREIEGSGFTGYLTKPVDIDALLAEIGQRLGGRQQVPTDCAPLDALDAIDAMREAAQACGPHSGVSAAPGATVAAAGPTRPASGPPIVSRLAHHPRLSKVARSFCATLPEKLAAMEQALADKQLDEVASLAHWLKGAGGTVGYDDFFEPAKRLESQARAGALAELRQTLQDIQSLAARIQPPPERAATAVEA